MRPIMLFQDGYTIMKNIMLQKEKDVYMIMMLNVIIPISSTAKYSIREHQMTPSKP